MFGYHLYHSSWLIFTLEMTFFQNDDDDDNDENCNDMCLSITLIKQKWIRFSFG